MNNNTPPPPFRAPSKPPSLPFLPHPIDKIDDYKLPPCMTLITLFQRLINNYSYFPLPAYEQLLTLINSTLPPFDENQEWIYQKAIEGVERFVKATAPLQPPKVKELMPTVGYTVIKYFVYKFSRKGCSNMIPYYLDKKGTFHYEILQKGDYDPVCNTYDWDEDYNQLLFEYLGSNIYNFGEDTTKWTNYDSVLFKNTVDTSIYEKTTNSEETFENEFKVELTLEYLISFLRKRKEIVYNQFLESYPGSDARDELRKFYDRICRAIRLLEYKILCRDHPEKRTPEMDAELERNMR